MVVVVEPSSADRALTVLGDRGQEAVVVGEVVEGNGEVEW
jgi:hydrogenase maturation factor